MDVRQMTDTQLAKEYARVQHLCAVIVSSVHGVIPAALNNRVAAVEAELDRRGDGGRVHGA